MLLCLIIPYLQVIHMLQQHFHTRDTNPCRAELGKPQGITDSIELDASVSIDTNVVSGVRSLGSVTILFRGLKT